MTRTGLLLLAPLLLLGAAARAQGDAPTTAPASGPPPAAPSDDDAGEGAPAAADPSDAAPPDPSDADPVADEPPSISSTTIILGVDPGAEARYQGCLARAADDDVEEARACLRAVVEQAPDTAASLKAEAALGALDALATSRRFERTVDETAPLIPPGRLELSSIAGLFGLWNGVAGGASVASLAPGLNPGATVLATGAVSLGLAAGFGVGGCLLADALDLDEGDSRLTASGIVWGSTFGLALVPTIATFATYPWQVPASLATIVAGGYVGGVAALGVSTFADLDASQVSLVNTGGWIGGFLGLLSVPNLAAWSVQTAAVYSATYVALGSAGLLAGGTAARFLDFTWGETLLVDLGAVAGIVTLGALTIGTTLLVQPQVDPRVGVLIVTGAPALGAVGGAAGAAFAVAQWRASRGEPALRLADLPVRISTGRGGAVLDRAGVVVPVLPLAALSW